MNRYIIKTATAQMPSSVKARYRRVAVIETDLPEGQEPAMISERAKGVVRIVDRWERCHVGQTDRGAYQRALAEAKALLAKLEAKP